MDRLLDDLRTISLAEAGALPLHREPVDLSWRSPADVLAAQRAVAEARRVELLLGGDAVGRCRRRPGPRPRDPRRTWSRTPSVIPRPAAGSRSRSALDGADALLIVADTGEGIAPEELGRVFDRFHRRSDSGGSGLGLTIVRDLATAHGGTVDVESDGVAGHGSTFRVRLPRRL